MSNNIPSPAQQLARQEEIKKIALITQRCETLTEKSKKIAIMFFCPIFLRYEKLKETVDLQLVWEYLSVELQQAKEQATAQNISSEISVMQMIMALHEKNIIVSSKSLITETFETLQAKYQFFFNFAAKPNLELYFELKSAFLQLMQGVDFHFIKTFINEVNESGFNARTIDQIFSDDLYKVITYYHQDIVFAKQQLIKRLDEMIEMQKAFNVRLTETNQMIS